MKYLFLLLIAVLLTSCFVFDKPPNAKIEIEKSILPEIDSIFLNHESPNNYYQNCCGKKITLDQAIYYLYPVRSNSRIKLILANSKIIFSDSTIFKKATFLIRISKSNGIIGFTPIVKSKIQMYFPLILVIFLIVFITKVPISLVINRPALKWRFVLLYTGLNLIYLLIFIVFIGLFEDKFAVLLYPFYLIILGCDIMFLIKQKTDKGLVTPIISGIVSNLLFLTIGQFAITFSFMYFA
jgi:hypothetical protein